MPIYMQYPGATGGVTATGFSGWIELQSSSFGMHRPTESSVGSGGYAATGKLEIQDIQISKTTDSASPQLMISALQGVFNSTVKIAFTTTSQGGMVNFLTYELDNCGISSLQAGGNPAGLPMEAYTLHFDKIVFTFNNMDEAGSTSPVITGYNLKLATSV